MAGRENKQIGERRRGRSRNGSMVKVNFNGGGILLLGAAAAGALLAAVFAVRRVSSHRRSRGVTERDALDQIDQEDFCKHLVSVEVPKIVEDEADKAGRVDEVNSSDNFDANHEISQVIERESDTVLLKEEDAERSSPKKIELACFRDSSAEKKALQNLEMIIIKEESNFGNRIEDDSSKLSEMMIIEEEGRIGESDRIKHVVSSDVFCDENGNAEGDSSVHKLLDGPGGLGEQTVVIVVSESEKCSCQDPDMLMEEENALLMTHDNGVVHIEEEVEDQDNELPSADGVDGLWDEVQRATSPPIGSPIKEAALSTEIYACDKPALIMEMEETRSEDNTNTDLNVVIQESVVGSVEIQGEMTEESLLNESQENMESSEIEENNRENKEPHSAESHERIESSLEQDNQMQNEGNLMIQFQGIELATREGKVSSDDTLPLSLEPTVMEVEPIQETNLKNSDKALKIEECNLEASNAQELGISLNKEDETISVQFHKTETMKNLEADKNKKAHGIEEQAAKLSFDIVKGVIKLVSVDQKKRQHQAEKNFEKNDLKKSKQKRTEAEKEKTTECKFTGYPKGQLFMMMTLAAAFAFLAIIYYDEFYHWSYHLGKNYHRLYQTFHSSYNITC